MTTSYPKQDLLVIYFNLNFLANKDWDVWQNPTVCKALLNVTFYYVDDDTDFWL